MKLLVKVVLASVLGAAAAGAGAGETGAAPADPLRPLLACSWGGLAAQGVSRWPAGQSGREVPTADGPKQVSVADGYRLMLAFPGSAPFVNLKLERSMPGRIAQDAATIRAQMEALGRGTGLAESRRDGVDILALDNATLDGFSVISLVTMIAEQKNVIATAYLLNAKPEQRKFGSYQEYMVLRNAFVDALARCLAAP